MKFELYIDNHAYQKGIEDYIYSIQNIFFKNNLKVNIVKKISKDVDVLFIIENFAKPSKDLINFLKTSKSRGVKLCLIHTEFVDENLYFNTFTSREIFYRKCLLVKILSYLYQLDNNDYKKLLFYSFLFVYLTLGFTLGFKFVEIKKRIFFALRDYNFPKYLKFFDYNIVLSDDLYNCLKQHKKIKNIFYLQNYFDISLFEKFISKDLKNNLLYLSGYKTPYRIKVLRNQNIKNFNNFFINSSINTDKYNFSKKNLIDFNLLFTKESFINKITNIYKRKFKLNINKFEIYIAQRKNWPYLSTTRIIRAFRNESIPINIGSYNKSNYEKLCINTKSLDHFIENYSLTITDYHNKLENNIKEFNTVSDDMFNYFIKNIK